MTVIITDHHEIPYKETEDGKNGSFRRQMQLLIQNRQDVNIHLKIVRSSVALKLVTASMRQMVRKWLWKIFREVLQPLPRWEM